MIPMTGNSIIEGIVEDVNDPDRNGRLRVRWLGVHTDNKAKLPTNLLPWCDVVQGINSAAISGVGQAPVGIVQGTMVIGFWKDAQDKQEAVVFGTLGGFRATYMNSTFGFNDPDGIYPRAGVAGDTNILAGGTGDTGSSYVVNDSAIQTTVPNSTDPTVPPPVLDPNAYKNTPWMPFAIAAIGINEKDNPDTIKQYHLIGGGVMREASVAWCAAFANWCLIQAGIGGTRSAASRSFASYGVSVGTTGVPYGAIAVFGVPNSGLGHVAFVVSDNGTTITCIGGNQSDHTASRSGGIVSKSTFPKTGGHLVLLDCRMPTNLDASK